MSCFSLSASCHGSHRNAEAALEYLHFLDENELLDGAGLISDNATKDLTLSHNLVDISYSKLGRVGKCVDPSFRI